MGPIMFVWEISFGSLMVVGVMCLVTALIVNKLDQRIMRIECLVDQIHARCERLTKGGTECPSMQRSISAMPSPS